MDHCGRVAQLEEALPCLGGRERLDALAELAWLLRERDTRRARALATEATSLLGTSEAGGVRARLDLTLAACALLFRELPAARESADAAIEGFIAAADASGAAEARAVRNRIARMLGEDVAPDAEQLETSWRRAFADAQRQLRDGEVEPAVEQLAHIAIEAPLQGMDEPSLEATLAIARVFGAFQHVDAALECAIPVVAEARTRGWRGLLASATASVSEWLVEAGEPHRALELLAEARASLAVPACAHVEPALERLLGEAQLAAGQPHLAVATLEAAEALLRDHGRLAEAARVTAIAARASAAAGEDPERALARATSALQVARETRSRAGEMEALAALASVHAAHPDGDRSTRSAVAFLRHAAEIADELDEPTRRAALLQELACLHEGRGELALALGAQKGAHAEWRRAEARRQRDLALALKACAIRERVASGHEAEAAHRALEQRQAAAVQRAHATLDRLRTAAGEIMEASDTATLVERLEREALEAAAADHVGLFVFDDGARTLTRHARVGGRAVPVRQVASGDLESYAARAARERRELLVEFESATASEAAELRDCATLWFGPVVSAGSVLGVLTVQSRRPHAFGERERNVFRALCDHAAVALARARLQAALRQQRELRIESEERLRRLSTTDALTSLATRAHFFAIARERLERARRDGGPCGLIVADIDAFKSINDIHGHAAGDRVLAAVAATIAQQLRDDDAAGRIGGEEFALFLSGATLEATVAAAERMRLAVEAHAVVHDGRAVNVTLSFGCTAVADAAGDLPDKPVAETVERLLREADAALYEAQGTGGNRTIAWPAYQALRALRAGPVAERDPQSFA